jgi:hypothetical protein
LLRREGLLAPQRVRGRRKPRPHDGTIIPAAPNQRWGTDATMAWTRSDGWVWVFVCVDHYTAEAWAHVAKVGDRFAALQPVYDAVTDRWGRLGPDVARGLSCAMTGGRSTARPISPARWPGSGSPTVPRSWVSRRPTAAPSAGSAPSRTSACGFSCTIPSRSSARPWLASSTATTAPGSFSATATAHPRRPTRQHKQPKRHDQTDHKSVQETECCSGVTITTGLVDTFSTPTLPRAWRPGRLIRPGSPRAASRCRKLFRPTTPSPARARPTP